MDIKRLKLEIKFEKHKEIVLNEFKNYDKYLNEINDMDEFQYYVLKYTEYTVRFIKIIDRQNIIDNFRNDTLSCMLFEKLNSFLISPKVNFETILMMQELIDQLYN